MTTNAAADMTARAEQLIVASMKVFADPSNNNVGRRRAASVLGNQPGVDYASGMPPATANQPLNWKVT